MMGLPGARALLRTAAFNTALLATAAVPTVVAAAATGGARSQPNEFEVHELTPFRAVYEVHLEGSHRGESTLSLERIPSGWRYTVEAEGTRGLARLSGFEASHVSDFALVDGFPRLHRSVARSGMLMRSRKVTLHFDWERGEARWRGDIDADRRGPLPLPEDAINAPLLNLALALDLRGKGAGEVLRYHLVDRGRADATAYAVGAPERIEMPYGTWHAIPLRNQRPEKDRITTVWFAPGLPPTPLRIVQEEDGKVKYELRLLRLE